MENSIREFTYLFQVLLGVSLILLLWILVWPRGPKSSFKLRESERQPNLMNKKDEILANLKLGIRKPLELTGIRTQGEPHEILGIKPDAMPSDIQGAYLNLIKHFHPDRIGPMGSREWKDAQEIAAALNQARAKMLEAYEEKHPKKPAH